MSAADNSDGAADSLAGGRSRPERTLGRRLMAAGAVALLGALVGIGLFQRDDDAATVRTAALVEAGGDTGVENAGLRGTAELVRIDDRHQLVLDVGELPVLTDEYFELWLVGADDAGRISLGPAVDDGRYPVPDSVAVDVFATVEISREALDGNPRYAGVSVLRGRLDP